MTTPVWDLFTSRQAPSSLWFGYHLARSLALRGQRMRLFTDELQDLATAVPDVNPSRWMQAHQQFDIMDLRMADITSVAPVAIQMLDTPIPPAYRGRLAGYPGPTRSVQVVTHTELDSGWDPSGPLVRTGVDGHCTQWLAQFGDPPGKAGYIKPQRHLALMRPLWGRGAAQTHLLQALGLRADLLENKLAVSFDVRLPYPVAPLLASLAVGPRPVCLFVAPESIEGAIARTNLPWVRERQGQSDLLTHGAVTLVTLPSRRWSLIDALVETVDLAMTTESDIAMRASATGTPVVWSCNDTGFLHWYADGAGPVIHRTLAAVFNAVATAQDVKSAWTFYLARWEDMCALAGRIEQRVRRAPDLADILLASLGDDSPDVVVRQFAPTEPGIALA